MDEARFQELLEKLKKPSGPRGVWEPRVFTMREYESMISSQLSEVALEMMKFTGPGSYMLTPGLFDLIDCLDRTVKIQEDPNLEKHFHLIASLIYLTQLEGSLDFDHILPENFAKHLERIIGPVPYFARSLETEPTLQVATFLAYPLLEGVVRRKLSQFISLEGKVLQEFTVKTKRGPGLYGQRRAKTDCLVKYDPKRRRMINCLNDELRLLEQQTTSPNLRAKLLRLDNNGIFDQIHDWRWPLLHGTLTASWHSITLFLLTCIILLGD
jgi:hypothetical protein